MLLKRSEIISRLEKRSLIFDVQFLRDKNENTLVDMFAKLQEAEKLLADCKKLKLKFELISSDYDIKIKIEQNVVKINILPEEKFLEETKKYKKEIKNELEYRNEFVEWD